MEKTLNLKKKVLTTGMAILASMAIVSTVSADEVDGDPIEGEENPALQNKVDFTIGGGDLTLETSPINTFGDIELKATPETHTTSFENAFQVQDLRGTQEGWNVTVQSSVFKVVEPGSGYAEGTEGFELPTGSLSLSPIQSIERVGDGIGDLPTGSQTDYQIIDDGTINVISAEVGTGVGVFDFTFSEEALSLVVDSTTAKIDNVNYPDESTPYEATVSWNIVSGPQ